MSNISVFIRKQKIIVAGIYVLVLFFSISSFQSAIAQDNRFLITTNFSATYLRNYPYHSVSISFYIKNVSDGGISVLLTQDQISSFRVSHMTTNVQCDGLNFGGIPYMKGRFHEGTARRKAVYIPKGDGFYVTVRKHFCHNSDNFGLRNGKITGGIVSGNVTVIKGRRILTRPISGRF